MSERTGATDEQVEAAVDRMAARTTSLPDAAKEHYRSEWFRDARRAAELIVPPDQRIVPADAVVLTAEEAGTVKEALHNATIDAEEQADSERGNGCLQEADLWTEAAGTYRALAAKLGGQA